MNRPESFFKISSQKHLQTVANNKFRYDGDDIKYSDMLILSKIEPQPYNDKINPETEFPIVNDLTSYYSRHGHTDLDILSRKGSGWNYFDKVVLNNGDKIEIDKKQYQVEVATVLNVVRREMILKDLESGKLVEVDIKNVDNQDYLYQQIQLSQKQNLKKKSSFKP